MSRLAGALCTFGLDVHPRSLPHYNHRDPGPGFDALDEHIRRHLEIVAPSQAIQIPAQTCSSLFSRRRSEGPALLRAFPLDPRNSFAGGRSRSDRQGSPTRQNCSAKFVPELVKRALPGLTLTHLEVPPSAVSAKVESQYFTVSRSGPCWEHIMQTRTVGVYVPGELPAPEMELVVILES